MSSVALAIYRNSTLRECAGLFDSAILMAPHYSIAYGKDLDLEEAISFCKKEKIEPVLALSRIFMENELEEALEFIKAHSDCSFLVSDIGLCQKMKEAGLLSRVIYDSSTMVCNSLDLSFYAKQGFRAVSMSGEIPLEDIVHAYEKTRADMFYQVFGQKTMFYSRRKLLELYRKHSETSFAEEGLCLKEEKREGWMPVYENENGFVVYRPYFVSLLPEYRKMDFLRYAYFDSLGLADNVIRDILSVFRSASEKPVSKEENRKILNDLGVLTEDGFTYQDTAYIKEKMFR